MVSSRLAFVALGVACVAAAGGGSYLATRHNVADQVAVPMTASADVPATEAASSAAPLTAAEPADTVARPERTERVPAATRAAPTPSATRAAGAAEPPRRARTTTLSRPEPPDPAPSRAETRVAVVEPPAEPVPAATEPYPPAPLPNERVADTLAALPEAPPTQFEELVVSADSVIGLQTETTLTSERARVEDRVEARVIRDVRVGGRVAIPAGTRAVGSVVVVERGGRLKERARLGIRFHTLALSDGTRLPISTETIYRFGNAPGNSGAAKIGGGAVAGAILGAILGGGKGAAIGAATGAAGGSAAVMTGERSEAVFQSGAEITARIISPITVTVDR